MEVALGWAAFLVGLTGTLVLMLDRGYRQGMHAAWFVGTLAVPGWFRATSGSLTVDAITGVGLAVVIATLVRPYTGALTRWVLTDFLLAGVLATSVTSDAVNGILTPGTIIELVRTWVLPYLVGRLFLKSRDDLRSAMPIVVTLATGISAFGLVEAVTRTNLLAVVSGKSWHLLDSGEGYRWGLKRAQGNTNHPIYFGLLLALTLPWLLVAARRAVRPANRRWWAAGPPLVAAAALVTVSRAAHFAVLIVLTGYVFFRRPGLRVPMLALAAALALFGFVFRGETLDLLQAYAGEAETGTDKVIIDGEEYDYSGTRHRDLLLKAYREPIEKAGLFGYGTMLRDMPVDPEMDNRFESIDHHYLLHYLKYGALGTAALLALAIGVTWSLAREAWFPDGTYADLAAGLCAAFAGVTIMIRGVAFSPDFSATWLFVAGLAATFEVHRRALRAGVPPPDQARTENRDVISASESFQTASKS